MGSGWFVQFTCAQGGSSLPNPLEPHRGGGGGGGGGGVVRVGSAEKHTHTRVAS